VKHWKDAKTLSKTSELKSVWFNHKNDFAEKIPQQWSDSEEDQEDSPADRRPTVFGQQKSPEFGVSPNRLQASGI
jgi:hypothetical protein